MRDKRSGIRMRNTTLEADQLASKNYTKTLLPLLTVCFQVHHFRQLHCKTWYLICAYRNKRARVTICVIVGMKVTSVTDALSSTFVRRVPKSARCADWNNKWGHLLWVVWWHSLRLVFWLVWFATLSTRVIWSLPLSLRSCWECVCSIP